VRAGLSHGLGAWGRKHSSARRGRLGLLAALAGCAVWLAACSAGPSVEQGQQLYRANGCASCHGASGRGDGPLAASLRFPPADLRNLSHYKNGSAPGEIAQTLAQGIMEMSGTTPQLHQNHHDLAMPKFDHLSERDRRSIALYLISIAQKGS
jgi:mono/diheme cytochrome c family protein